MVLDRSTALSQRRYGNNETVRNKNKNTFTSMAINATNKQNTYPHAPRSDIVEADLGLILWGNYIGILTYSKVPMAVTKRLIIPPKVKEKIEFYALDTKQN